jgi:hypothetical protein
MVGPRWKLEAERVYFCSSGTFKTYDDPWEEGGSGDSHLVISEWGGAQVVPSQERVVPEPKHG